MPTSFQYLGSLELFIKFLSPRNFKTRWGIWGGKNTRETKEEHTVFYHHGANCVSLSIYTVEIL